MDIISNPFKGEGTIKYRNKNHKVKLTLNSFRMLTAKFGISLDGFDKAFTEDPLTTLAQLAYCGLVNGAIAAGKKFEDDFDTFCVYFYEDEKGFVQMQELLQAATPDAKDESGEGNE